MALSRPISAGALRHRHQHHVHHQYPGHGQADCGNTRHTQRQRAQDAVEGGEHGVLGDDGDIVFAVVAQLERVLDGGFGRLDGVAAARFDQDAEQRGGVEQFLRVIDRDDGDFIGIETHRFAL